eukprot:CAMPEP_0113631394 /NCGR_PEP_ID=MMETSP0017_2-20120614/16314_1 /TAXON_ID=2856 /ORGANISM="Cylindrotheca closterium" /LENGTH=170 /DNA_ID=CAMNT_0000541901 /DNA_START=21 /DNA_END=533 /DNA_ORIENTATION=- /assembly_acc=CAM_ASM_000147
MKFITLLSLVGVVASFAPQEAGRPSTEINSLFDNIANMDLFAPVKDQNDYGARSKKKLAVGKINSGSSYVPAGLTADEYNKLRNAEAAKKKANYDKNVKKAGIFIDYTDWYIKRGTDNSQKWAKSVTKGHEMAKTKYDWQNIGSAKRVYRGAAAAEKDTTKKSGFSFFKK